MEEKILQSDKQRDNMHLKDYPKAITTIEEIISGKGTAEVRLGRNGLMVREIKAKVKYEYSHN